MDHNGTTPFDADALTRYVHVSQNTFGNPSTMCIAGNEAKKQLDESRMTIAAELGAKQTEIIFTSGATESNVIIIRGFAERAKRLRKKCMILTTPIEHASVDNTISSLDGVNVARIDVDKYGLINVAHVFALLGKVPSGSEVLICVIWVNNEIGTVQDVRSLIRICRTGAPGSHVHIHMDATQTVGRYLLNFGELDIDSASFSAHKFYSAHGVGGLYLRRKCELSTPMTGGKQEKGIRGGTENVPGVASMALALQKANKRLRDGWQNHIKSLRDYMLSELQRLIPGVIVNTHPTHCAYNTISVCLPCDSRELIAHLSNKHRICLAVGSACSKGGISKTLKAVGLSELEIQGSMRISLGVGNTMWQCRKVVNEITKFVRRSQSVV